MQYVSPSLTACLFVNPEGSYPKPSISVSPGGVIPMGGNVTIRCRHQRLGMRFLLYKAGDGNYLTYTDPAGSEAEFPITSARREHGGSYTCRYSNRTVRVAYSEPSDPVQIIVAEPSYPKPNISLHPSERVALGGAVTVRCECRCAGARVLLSKAGDPDARRSMDPAGNVAEFPIRNVNRGDAGNYSCQYSTKSDLSVWSEPSDPVELVVTGGSEPLSPLDLTHTIITGMSVAAAGLLLLLVAFVCYRRTRGRKGPAPRQSRESEAVKALPSQPQETDSGAKELIYTELGHQAKPGVSAPAPEPVLYATINVSRRPDEQSPRGAGCPPPTPIA
ncbi:T-cell-interacting, activating receptor on myeloid cells protein 1-like [Chrysemys picta bellii]|uniref:T-cell-interacting, activating receptor on myeloid cells protein 1-like n=1 Tax=Chrysemys picta bellii TaxID=8478 RepID=UPI0032B2C14A